MATRKAAVVEDIPEVNSEVELARVASLSLSTRQHRVADVTSLSDLRAIIGDTRDWQEIEPSFDVVEQGTFEGIPVVIGGFRINDSKKYFKGMQDENGNEVKVASKFVSLLCAGYDEETGMFITPWVIVNDGGTGIRDQIQRYVDRYDGDARIAPPITASKGFRKSEYPFEDPSTGDVSTSTTWYIG